MDLINVAQNRDKWQALVNTVMDLVFHKVLESSWLAEELSGCQEDCPLELANVKEWASVKKALNHQDTILLQN
jgi:hypothetical protein